MPSSLLPIHEIAQKLKLNPAQYETIGAYGAKLKLDLLNNPRSRARQAHPCHRNHTTVSGEGKTVVSIALPRASSALAAKAS